MDSLGLTLSSMPAMMGGMGKKKKGMMPGIDMGGADMAQLMPMLQMLMGGQGVGGFNPEAPPQMRGVGGTGQIKQPFSGGILGRGL